LEACEGRDELLEEAVLLDITLLDASRLDAVELDELAAVLDGVPESELPPPPQAERIKVKPRP
jgi:hypothetical protein